MLTTAQTWFYIILAGLTVFLLINEEKLLEKEAEYEHRKSERKVKKDESLSQKR